jgi:hypothetical protein
MFEFILKVLFMWSPEGLLHELRYITRPQDPDESRLPVKLVQVGQVDDTCVSET